MSIDQDAPAIPRVVLEVDAGLQFEIEQFLYLEARLLDERKFDDWYLLFADDIHYWMPTRYNRLLRELDQELAVPTRSRTSTRTSARSASVSSASTPAWRGRRIRPLARATSCATSGCGPPRPHEEYDVQSAFLTYRNRGDTEVDVWAGRRDDLLRRIAPGTWQIARRKITIDQSTILSKNLSVFF